MESARARGYGVTRQAPIATEVASMRRLIASGLYLLCGLMAARAYAQEAQWRPATPRHSAQAAASSSSSFVTLARPVPQVSRVPETLDRVTPVSYESATLETPRP